MNIRTSLNFNLSKYLRYLENVFHDRKVCRFLTIIQNLDQINEQCKNDNLTNWLKEKNVEIIKIENRKEYHKFFSINRFDIKNENLAFTYAKILEYYKPDLNGKLSLSFNYLELVTVIKNVFELHVGNDENLLHKGIKQTLKSKVFYAKVESNQVRIIYGEGKKIDEGSCAVVTTVYEIASHQFMALKLAKMSQNFVELLFREVKNLNRLHEEAEVKGISVELIQDRPITTFEVTDFVGYLTPLYSLDLFNWTKSAHSNEERIDVCKKIMRAHHTKKKLNCWHGDLKPENILINNNGVKIIDWAGCTFFQDQESLFKLPGPLTPDYISTSDLDIFTDICEKAKIENDEEIVETLKTESIKCGESMELFSISITLFIVLTSYAPLVLVDENRGYEFPKSDQGIYSRSLNILYNRKYSSEVISTITKMLAHHPQDRYSFDEALAIWEKLG